MSPVAIGICGLGTVGSGTVNVLQRNFAEISARAGCAIEIRQIGARRDNLNCDLGKIAVTRDIFEVAENPEIDILIEAIGGTTTALDLVKKAIVNGKHVITANKALIAEYGNEIFTAAEKAGVSVCYEAAVAGGIPIIKCIREGLSANRIKWLAGIINGTGNFILTEMRDKKRDFSDVLAEAQALGYAETDPTFDVEGIDAAHKLVILASIAFAIPLQFDKVYTEGITEISQQDMRYAEELGYRIKHLGIARRTDKGIELRVHPSLIPEKQLIANVNGVKNAVLVESDAVGSTLYYGAGAGAEPTASAVIADIIDIARQISAGQAPLVPLLGFSRESLSDVPIVAIDDVKTSYYLRMSAQDKSGVLSAVTSILSDAGISVEALIQKAPEEGETSVPLIILTNMTIENKLMAAVNNIEQLPTINNGVTRIRVEPLYS